MQNEKDRVEATILYIDKVAKKIGLSDLNISLDVSVTNAKQEDLRKDANNAEIQLYQTFARTDDLSISEISKKSRKDWEPVKKYADGRCYP